MSERLSPCGECGALVPTKQRHDFIDCVTHRWEVRDFEPGRIPSATIRSDVRALVGEVRNLRALSGELVAVIADEAAYVGCDDPECSEAACRRARLALARARAAGVLQ